MNDTDAEIRKFQLTPQMFPQPSDWEPKDMEMWTKTTKVGEASNYLFAVEFNCGPFPMVSFVLSILQTTYVLSQRQDASNCHWPEGTTATLRIGPTSSTYYEILLNVTVDGRPYLDLPIAQFPA